MKKHSKLFGSLQILTVCAMMVAISVVLGWIGRTYFTFAGGSIRITFENLPIIFCGITFGPVIGFIVGILSDLVSCLVAPQPAVLPLITLGAGAVGLISGLISRFVFKNKRNSLVCILLSAIGGHAVGSVILKTIALLYYYSSPLLLTFGTRGITYILICGIEIFLLYVILKNREISKLMREITRNSEKVKRKTGDKHDSK
jgi:ECF transporter S component (folate family)